MVGIVLGECAAVVAVAGFLYARASNRLLLWMFFLVTYNRTVIKFRVAIVYAFGMFLGSAGFCRLSLVCATVYIIVIIVDDIIVTTTHCTVYRHTILLGFIVTVSNLHITVIPTALDHTIIMCMRQLLLREYHWLIIIIDAIVIIYMQRRRQKLTLLIPGYELIDRQILDLFQCGLLKRDFSIAGLFLLFWELSVVVVVVLLWLCEGLLILVLMLMQVVLLILMLLM